MGIVGAVGTGQVARVETAGAQETGRVAWAETAGALDRVDATVPFRDLIEAAR